MNSIFIVDKSIVPFQIWRLQTEIELRGKWVTVSAQLEFLLSKIIIYANNKNPLVNREFNKVKFWRKIKWAKEDLSNSYPQLYAELEPYFATLDGLIEIRNNIAHRSFQFDENETDKSFVIVTDIVWKDGDNVMELIKYPLDFLDEKYIAFKDTTRQMINAWIHLVNDFSKDNPNFSVLSKI